MTSSYNIYRRPKAQLLAPTNFEAQQKQFGTCPPGYVTVPITTTNGNCTDWKFCVPLKRPDPPKRCAGENTRRYSYHLYDETIPLQSPMNMYPPESRRPDRRYLDKEDYYRLPIAFNGTGYTPTRSWEYAETATDYVTLPDQWSPFHLIQRRDMQKKAVSELKERRQLGFAPNFEPYLGTFYK